MTNEAPKVKHAQKADAQALELLEKITPMHRRPMERYLRANPPTIPVIAALAFVAKEVEKKRAALERKLEEARRSARGGSAPRRSAVNPQQVLEEAAKLGWPGLNTKAIKRTLMARFDRSESQINKILNAPPEKNFS